MNTQKQKIATLTCIALGMLAAFSSCGRDRNNNNNNVAAVNQCPVGQTWNGIQCTLANNAWGMTTATAACPVGQVQTQEYGCVTQAGCDASQSLAMWNNQCVRVTIINNGMNNGMMNPGMNPMMNAGMNMGFPGMNTGFGVQLGMNNGMNLGMNNGFGMQNEFGPSESDLSDCNAYSQDNEVHYSCGTGVYTSNAGTAGLSNRQRRRACARGLILTSYGCLPKKGCRRNYGNLDGYCVR